MDRLIKYIYLTLTENGFPTLSNLISFVVLESKNCTGILVWMGILSILVQCRYLEPWYWIEK